MDLTGRLLLATLFALGAVQKCANPGPVQDLLAGAGLPVWLVWPAAVANAAGALALLFAPVQWRRATGVCLAAYCGATSLFHLIPADAWQMTIFVKNWAIAGGLLILAGTQGRAGGPADPCPAPCRSPTP
ncbi:MAG TPA: DoxX protein [Paracoccaceae bacterium]|nr:DoxX protein [Paracoccaceae bacterium]HMO70530.1 DoxX protein [Paracoccaceae bacterium]